MAAELGWDDAEQRRQVEQYRALVAAEREAGGSARDRARRTAPQPSQRRARSLAANRGCRRTGARRRRRSRSRATPAGVTAHLSRASASRSTTRSRARLAATGAERRPTPADGRRRSEPRLVAARDDLGARRPGRRARGGRRAARTPPARSPRSSRACNEARVSRDRRRRAQRRVRRERAGVRRRAARPHRARGHRRRRHRRRCSSTCCPGTFGDVFEDELRAEHGVTCGHWPQSMALSTVGGWLACRGAGQLSTRYGKIEDIVDRPRRRARRRHARSRPAARRAPRSGPTSRSSSSAPRARSAIIVGARLRVHPLPPAEVPRRVRVHVVRRRPRRDAPHRAARRDAGRAAALRRDRGRPQLPDRRRERAARARRRRRARRRGDACASSTRSARRPTPLDVALVEQWMEHRNDVSALEALDQRGFVVDTMEISALVARAARGLRAGDRGDPRGRAHDGRVGAPEPLLHRRRRASTSPSRASRPKTEREPYYRAAWDAGQRAVLAAGGALQPPPRGRPEPRPASSPTRSAPASACCSRVKDSARPERHPQPGQARTRAARSATLAWP